ncbi:TPA: twin-arginine translocation signal domain-containing protein [Escherichia coli]|nr:twin-arginine translocation signal domain-containing protein [Escherichia coli]
MNRRNFIKAASCGALLTGALPSVSHAAAERQFRDRWGCCTTRPCA